MTGKQEKKSLSSRAIETMKIGDKDKSDNGENRGLRVTCGETGLKTFFYRYTSPLTGRLKQVKIGNYPKTSLAVARTKLHELKMVRQEGRCPATELKQEEKQNKEAANKQNSELTVQNLVELYLSERIEDRKTSDGKVVLGVRKKKGQAEVRRMLYADVVPILGCKLAKNVTRLNVIELINRVISRGARVQAGNVLRELTLAYEFAIGLGHLDQSFANPALLAKSSLQQSRIKLTCTRGTRILNENELIKFLEWLPGSAYTVPIKNVLRLTLWTGCRTGEICRLAWDDVNFDKGIIHLKETKTGIERDVQLSVQAIAFLNGLRLSTDKYLFPSQGRNLPIQQEYLTQHSWRLRDAKKMLDIPHWTPHDLRRTVRTGLSRLQCPNEVGEAILGHTKGGIEGIYNLYKYDSECKVWLQKWADYLDGLVRR